MPNIINTTATVLRERVIPWDGKPISRPGIYSGVPIDFYHGKDLCVGPSVSRSGLWKIFDKSLAHYFKDSPYNPRTTVWEESEALVLGRATHHLLLGEAAFHSSFAIRPDEFDSWRTKAAKDWRKACWAVGKSVLEPKHLEQIRGMSLGLHAEPLIRQGVLNGLIEHTIVARDEETGVWLKIRPDAIPNDSGDFGDLKTTADISDEGLESAIGRDGLFMQGGLTALVCEMIDLPFNSFTLAFIEKDDPFCCQVRTLKPADIDLGIKASKAALYEFARAYNRSAWLGPGAGHTDAAYIEMKPWARKRTEDRIALLEASQSGSIKAIEQEPAQ